MNIEQAMEAISDNSYVEMFEVKIDRYNSEYTIVADGVVFGPYFKQQHAEHIYSVAYDAMVKSLTNDADFLDEFYERMGDYE